MFDLRYHVASLAAVFIALAIGVVIGVAIASGGEVDRQTADFRQQQIEDLRDDLARTERQLEAVRATGAADAAFTEAVYPTLVNDRLAGSRIVLVVLGERRGVVGDVDDVLRRAGATGPSLQVSLPLDGAGIDGILTGDASLASYAGTENRELLGEALGEELARGGDTPLWDALGVELLDQVSGSLDEGLAGAVIARTWLPEGADPPNPQTPEVQQSEAFLTGLLRGLAVDRAPLVGVQRLTDPQMIPWYVEWGASSVDDTETAAGRVAVALLLDGAKPGHYGAGETATDGVIPDPDSVPLLAGG